jgi:hypothetical protein
MTTVAAAASIDVPGQAFAQVSIQIGDRQLDLDRDVSQVRFYLDPDSPELEIAPLPEEEEGEPD